MILFQMYVNFDELYPHWRLKKLSHSLITSESRKLSHLITSVFDASMTLEKLKNLNKHWNTTLKQVESTCAVQFTRSATTSRNKRNATISSVTALLRPLLVFQRARYRYRRCQVFLFISVKIPIEKVNKEKKRISFVAHRQGETLSARQRKKWVRKMKRSLNDSLRENEI